MFEEKKPQNKKPPEDLSGLYAGGFISRGGEAYQFPGGERYKPPVNPPSEQEKREAIDLLLGKNIGIISQADIDAGRPWGAPLEFRQFAAATMLELAADSRIEILACLFLVACSTWETSSLRERALDALLALDSKLGVVAAYVNSFDLPDGSFVEGVERLAEHDHVLAEERALALLKDSDSWDKVRVLQILHWVNPIRGEEAAKEALKDSHEGVLGAAREILQGKDQAVFHKDPADWSCDIKMLCRLARTVFYDSNPQARETAIQSIIQHDQALAICVLSSLTSFSDPAICANALEKLLPLHKLLAIYLAHCVSENSYNKRRLKAVGKAVLAKHPESPPLF